MERDYNTGKIIEFHEVPIQGAGSNPRNSLSLCRAPAPASDTVRGDPTNFPFWPGGLPFPEININEENDDIDINGIIFKCFVGKNDFENIAF